MEHHPLGQNALYQMLKLSGPQPHTLSYALTRGVRRTVEQLHKTHEYYPASAKTHGSLRENMRFAFKHEPLDLRTINAALVAMGASGIAQWVYEEPTGRYSRLAWFFFERFIGFIPELPSAYNAPYVPALDPAKHYTASLFYSQRHKIYDNLLGKGNLCPVIRRTRKLEEAINKKLGERVRAIAAQYPPAMLNRAVDYLYTRETRSSFDIEGESPTSERAERFLQALRNASTFNTHSKKDFIFLQSSIVDEQFAANDWRTDQVYVSTTKARGREHVHYICPKPSDVPYLMQGLFDMAKRVGVSRRLDPVLAAAIVSFGFVFIHPFNDGNGRIHRFLIHAMLAQRGFTPGKVIFPVSSAILRDRNQYHQVLDGFSVPIKPCIKWQFYGDDEIEVSNETLDLYRFYDATPLVEYLYERIEDTVTVDFKNELEYLARYDIAFDAVQNIVDMPDKDIALMVKLCLQNGGFLSKNKKSFFPLLRDEQISQMESAIQEIMQTSTPFEDSENLVSEARDGV